MKKIIIALLVISIQVTYAQSVLIEPGKQGINNLNTPKATFEMNGNGMLIQQKYKLTTADPNSQIILMPCSTPTPTSNALAGILKDPNGDAQYIGGISYDCRYEIDLSSDANVVGIRFIIEELNIGSGDQLYAPPLLSFGSNDPIQGDTAYVFAPNISFHFQTNTDNLVGNGFRIRWQALLADDAANPLQNIKRGSPKFAVDINNHVFRFGKSNSHDNYEPNSIAIGNEAWVSGGGIAIGSGTRATNGIGAVAIGNGATSLGPNAIALGQSTFAIGTNSFAILGGYTDGSNSAVIGNSNVYSANGGILIGIGNSIYPNGTNSIGLGENNRIEHASNVAIGKNLLSTNSNSIIMGTFNGGNVSTVSPTSPTARIYELGNGTSSTIKHNAMTVLANGNIGIGVYAPTEILDVSGNLKLSGNSVVSGNSSVIGNSTINGTFRLGAGGSVLNEVIKFTKTIDLPSIATVATNLQSFTVTGAEVGSTVFVSPSAALNDGIVIASARVSALNTVDIKFSNITAAAINPASMDFYITIIR